MDNSRQKLLLRLYAVANELGCNFDAFLTDQDERIKFQKKIYAAQRSGFSFGYNYSLYVHGPYCSSLADDGYEIARDLDAYRGCQYSFSAKGQDKISIAKRFYNENDAVDWLETITTLDYLCKLQRNRGIKDPGELKRETFASFEKVKPLLSSNTDMMEAAWASISDFERDS